MQEKPEAASPNSSKRAPDKIITNDTGDFTSQGQQTHLLSKKEKNLPVLSYK